MVIAVIMAVVVVSAATTVVLTNKRTQVIVNTTGEWHTPTVTKKWIAVINRTAENDHSLL
jgi:hypothetical protein